jgi:hypothetical protein
MARAQELQEWVWEMENGHGGATHIFVMANLHVKRPMFYPHNLDLAFYVILQMHSVHFKQPMFYILEWVLVVYHIL